MLEGGTGKERTYPPLPVILCGATVRLPNGTINHQSQPVTGVAIAFTGARLGHAHGTKRERHAFRAVACSRGAGLRRGALRRGVERPPGAAGHAHERGGAGPHPRMAAEVLATA